MRGGREKKRDLLQRALRSVRDGSALLGCAAGIDVVFAQAFSQKVHLRCCKFNAKLGAYCLEFTLGAFFWPFVDAIQNNWNHCLKNLFPFFYSILLSCLALVAALVSFFFARFWGALSGGLVFS